MTAEGRPSTDSSTAVEAPAVSGSPLDGILLFGLRRRSIDLLATVAVVAFLLWSRFSLLASGPWEWDETIFARGIFDFDLVSHFPHPPGFPGWMALGHLFLPLGGTPLRSFQLASALLSVLALWPLVSLGRRVAPPVVAVTDAAILGARTDGVLLVMKAGRTRREDAARAKDILEKVRVRVVGAALTNLPRDQVGASYG